MGQRIHQEKLISGEGFFRAMVYLHCCLFFYGPIDMVVERDKAGNEWGKKGFKLNRG